MHKSLTISEVQAVEAKIGRRLTPREIISGEVERIDKRTTGERIDAQLWEPVMKPPAATTPYDDHVAEAERAADEEQCAKLTPAQRRLAEAKNMQARELRKQTEAAAMAEHLAKHAPQIEKLQALKDSIRLDPSWTAADVETINRALAQLNAGPHADAVATATLISEPYEVLAGKKQSLRNDANAKRAELEAQIAAMDADITSIGAPRTSARACRFDES